MNSATPTDPSLELRDIKPAIDIPEPAAWPLWATLALAALAIALVILGWWLARRRQTPAVPSASEAALAELGALGSSCTAPDAYVMAVSDILRRYIQARFGIGASRQTTEEFLETITTSRPAAIAVAHQTVLRQFLSRCDEVKFARCDLDQDQRQRLHDVAQSFIQTSDPETPAESPEATPDLQPSLQH
jgi:hypothetical protein